MNSDQMRMALAAIDISGNKLGTLLGLDRKTVHSMGKRNIRSTVAKRKIKEFFARYVDMVDPSPDHGSGVILKLGAGPGCWKNGTVGPEPVDEAGDRLLEYWRERPEEWAALPAAARAAMLAAIYGAAPEEDPIHV